MNTGQALETVTDPLLLSAITALQSLEEECAALVNVVDNATSSQDPDASREAFSLQKSVHARIAELRGLNLDAIVAIRDAKQKTSAVRQDVDSLHLELQNLYYQQRHLRGEIQSLQNYRHTYTSLPLISEDEFLELHPHLREAPAHDLMIARIKHERAERVKLDKLRREVGLEKKTLMADNLRRRQNLTKIDRDLTKMIGNATSILKDFEKER